MSDETSIIVTLHSILWQQMSRQKQLEFGREVLLDLSLICGFPEWMPEFLSYLDVGTVRHHIVREGHLFCGVCSVQLFPLFWCESSYIKRVKTWERLRNLSKQPQKIATLHFENETSSSSMLNGCYRVWAWMATPRTSYTDLTKLPRIIYIHIFIQG